MLDSSQTPWIGLTAGDDTFMVGLTDQSFCINAGAGNDAIKTSYGSDVVRAGAGNDIIESSGGNDRIFGGEGDDVLIFGTFNDPHDYGAWLFGGIGRDFIYSYSGRNVVVGGAESDFLYDIGGTSVLLGGTGKDTLSGTGNDILVGGSDIDLFKVTAVSYYDYRPLVDITIVDFTLYEGDKLDLSGLGIYDSTTNTMRVDPGQLLIQGDDLWIMREGTSPDVVAGVGFELELIGLPLAIDLGIIELVGHSGKG